VLPRQAKKLDGASMQDPSLNLAQGEVDNRLRINQPHQLHRSDGDIWGRRRMVGEKNFTAPNQGDEE
jgi:hypothetical protein